MATNGLVTPVVDGSGFHNRFGGAEDVLDCPECFVDVSDRLGVVEAISAHHPEPVVACFGFDLLLINREMIVTLNFQVATVTFVTHQTLVPLSKLLLEVRDNCFPVVPILTALFFIKTNDIATIVYPHFLDFKRCWIFGVAALRNALKPWIFAAEHRQINFLPAAHPYPDNVSDRWITAFKCLQRFLAHHPTISHHSVSRSPNRSRIRLTTGTRVVTSAVLPGHISQQIGQPSTSTAIPTTICLRSGR